MVAPVIIGEPAGRSTFGTGLGGNKWFCTIWACLKTADSHKEPFSQGQLWSIFRPTHIVGCRVLFIFEKQELRRVELRLRLGLRRFFCQILLLLWWFALQGWCLADWIRRPGDLFHMLKKHRRLVSWLRCRTYGTSQTWVSKHTATDWPSFVIEPCKSGTTFEPSMPCTFEVIIWRRPSEGEGFVLEKKLKLHTDFAPASVSAVLIQIYHDLSTSVSPKSPERYIIPQVFEIIWIIWH